MISTFDSLHHRRLRAEMRTHALQAREEMAEQREMGGRFSQRCNRIAFYIQLACDYRRMANNWRAVP